jgi:hypothetical protein
LIEVKKSDTKPSTGILYYNAKLKPESAIQLVLELKHPMEKNGVKILPLGDWLQSL